jgi:Protein of unknown function (DUF3082)
MSDELSTAKVSASSVVPESASPKMPSPLNCVLGSGVAFAFAFLLYGMTSRIAVSFASKPIQTDSLVVSRLSAAIRTLVVGMSAMGTGIFGLAALGLLGLGIQLLFKKPAPSD